MRDEPKCPQCGGVLLSVSYPEGCTALNRDQWESTIAGNWYCEKCPSNNRGTAGVCYWWDREVTQLAPPKVRIDPRDVEIAAEKKRADENFASYERVKDLLSQSEIALKLQRECVTELEKGLSQVQRALGGHYRPGEALHETVASMREFLDTVHLGRDEQFQRVCDLEVQAGKQATTMQAAAAEIEEHWAAHCDAAGAGPINLMDRLRSGRGVCYLGYCEVLRKERELHAGRVRDARRAFADFLMMEGSLIDYGSNVGRETPSDAYARFLKETEEK